MSEEDISDDIMKELEQSKCERMRTIKEALYGIHGDIETKECKAKGMPVIALHIAVTYKCNTIAAYDWKASDGIYKYGYTWRKLEDVG